MLSKDDWQRLANDRDARVALTSKSFEWFFTMYFAHYITHATAPFQKEMMAKASDPSIEQLGVMAFRESGKSSILTTAFPLWAVTGVLQKKFVVIVSRTQELAAAHLRSIADALDEDVIKKDIWPHEVEQNVTNAGSITLPKYGARIIAFGREQAMRGLRHGAHRPDLIIMDDIEDTSSVKSPEARDASYKWFTSELIPIGSDNAKYIYIGNLIHEDSLLSRIREEILSGARDGEFLEYPIVRDDEPLWKARFPDMAAIEKLERKVGNPVTWMREYMLRLVSDNAPIIKATDIQTFSKIPAPGYVGQKRKMIVGVDPAISEKTHRDMTAMVRITVVGVGSDKKYYVHANPINKQLDIVKTVHWINLYNKHFSHPKFYIEQVAYQRALVQLLEQSGMVIDVKGVNPNNDKRSRLAMIAYKIISGDILFENRGCEELIKQLINFDTVAHDDLVDALTLAIIAHEEDEPKRKGSGFSWGGERRPKGPGGSSGPTYRYYSRNGH
jgi:predicted phage terminase large subunit-like protein